MSCRFVIDFIEDFDVDLAVLSCIKSTMKCVP